MKNISTKSFQHAMNIFVDMNNFFQYEVLCLSFLLEEVAKDICLTKNLEYSVWHDVLFWLSLCLA